MTEGVHVTTCSARLKQMALWWIQKGPRGETCQMAYAPSNITGASQYPDPTSLHSRTKRSTINEPSTDYTIPMLPWTGIQTQYYHELGFKPNADMGCNLNPLAVESQADTVTSPPHLCQ